MANLNELGKASNEFKLPKIHDKLSSKKIEGKSVTDMLNEFVRSIDAFKDKSVDNVEFILYRRNSGKAVYTVGKYRYELEPEEWCIMYPDEDPYLSSITEDGETEDEVITSNIEGDRGTFIVVDKTYYSNVLSYYISTEKELLEGDIKGEKKLPRFDERYFGKNQILNAVLNRLIQIIKNEMNSKSSSIFIYSGYAELIQEFVKINFPSLVIEKQNEIVPSNIQEEEEKRIDIAIKLIHENYNDDLNLEQLSDASCLSKFHFLRVFKNITNLTPHQYITKLRMEKSYELLEKSNMSIEDICNEVGLGSIDWFRQLFKKTFGESPTSVRKKYRKK